MESEKRVEHFKIAISSTIKAISKKKELNIFFTETPAKELDKINLPKVNFKSNSDFDYIRALSDSEALRIRHSNEKTYKKNEPSGTIAKNMFKSAEKIRYEKLGSDYFKGIEKNFKNFYVKKFNEQTDDMYNNIEKAFDLILANYMLDLGLDLKSKKSLKNWTKLIDDEFLDKFRLLKDNIGSQDEYSKVLRKIFEQLKLEDAASTDNTETDNTPPAENPLENKDKNQNSNDKQNQKENFSIESIIPDVEIDANLSEQKVITEEDGNSEDEVRSSNLENKSTEVKYKIFTNKFDKIINAEEIVEPSEMARFRDNLDYQLKSFQNVISRLANKLQRKLLAFQNRSWEFDLDDGMLDSAKLTRVIIDPLNSLSYKLEKNTNFKDTVVTLLIDNSGSMRGKPISIAAICADILSRTLERCSVKVEVLGFTTVNWKGGKSRELWLKNKIKNPGRLNDLSHIIYKSADTPWRRGKNNFGLMLKEGILKENIDGEAILWAYQRLRKRPEERKILMVISDGAPVDDSTLSVNAGNYLEKHLKNIVRWIENKNDIEINAIGIGHDVSSYYSRALKIADVQELGDALIDQLADLFMEDSKRKKKLN
ncbi:MAG: cobaltochelatase CobT-related protein [Candidatus Fonsibacter sp.]|nr:cobalamin biosynthesis protein CobT [Pelagibacterales bacterium]